MIQLNLLVSIRLPAAKFDAIVCLFIRPLEMSDAFYMIHFLPSRKNEVGAYLRLLQPLVQGWPNFLTRGPNSRLPARWRAGCSAIYIINAKIGCLKCIAVQ